MSSPIAWQGDGPPQTLSPSFSAQYSDQFDVSHSLASLTFVAAQSCTLLQSVTAAARLPSVLLLPTSRCPPRIACRRFYPHCQTHSLSLTETSSARSPMCCPPHSSSSRCPPTSLPRTRSPCPTLLPNHRPPRPHPLHSPQPSIAVPPRFTIRVVTDLEPVTPTVTTWVWAVWGRHSWPSTMLTRVRCQTSRADTPTTDSLPGCQLRAKRVWVRV